MGALIKTLSDQIKQALEALLDMCNADSYLTSFLQNALTFNKEGALQSAGAPSPSGLPVANKSLVYVPKSLLNINELIDKSNIQPRYIVYSEFRKRFTYRIHR